MRTTTLVLAGLLLSSLAVVFVPEANAVGICSDRTSEHCGNYLVCVGYRWGPGYFECTGPGIQEPPCACDPYPSPL